MAQVGVGTERSGFDFQQKVFLVIYHQLLGLTRSAIRRIWLFIRVQRLPQRGAECSAVVSVSVNSDTLPLHPV
jgi:hypothetical protein